MKYQAVYKFYGTDGLTKTVPCGKWQNNYNAAYEDLVAAKPDELKKESDWVECGNDIRTRK